MSEDFEDEIAESIVRLEPSPLLAPVRTDVIALNEDTDPDTLITTLGIVKNYLAELKQLKAWVETAMMERIKAHGNIVVSPSIFYTVGKDKKVKPKDLARLVDALWEAAGGDVGRFVGCLASNAIKHGAAGKLLTPEAFAENFDTVFVEKVVEGKAKPVEKLARIDRNFV